MRAPQRLRMAYDEPEVEEGYDDEEDDEEEDEDEEDESEETWQVGPGEWSGPHELPDSRRVRLTFGG